MGDEDLLRGSISKEKWLRKEFSPLSSSLPVSLLHQANAMARQQSTHQPRSTHQQSIHQLQSTLHPSTHQQSIHQLLSTLHQRSTHRRHLIMEDITSHFVNASTPSMGNQMHTGETRTPCVDPRGQGSATSTATRTVETSSLLQVHQGASLP